MPGDYIYFMKAKTICVAAILAPLFILACACPSMAAGCSYRDLNYADRAELKQADRQIYVCVSGQWVREKSILPLISVEKASLWTDCCGWTDLTFYAKETCDGQPECAIPPANGWAAKDQDPYRWRHLKVAYHCEIGAKDVPTSHFAKQVEETVPLTISCRIF